MFQGLNTDGAAAFNPNSLGQRVWGQPNEQLLDTTYNHLWRANNIRAAKRTVESKKAIRATCESTPKEFAPQVVATETQANPLEYLKQYAEWQYLEFAALNMLGINLFKKSIKNILDKCPADGSISETVSGGQYTGKTAVGTDGKRTRVKTGEITDRYFKNKENTYFHVRAINSEGVPAEVEQFMETTNRTRIHIFRLTTSKEVRLTVITPDGKHGCQLTLFADEIDQVLSRIKQDEWEHWHKHVAIKKQ